MWLLVADELFLTSVLRFSVRSNHDIASCRCDTDNKDNLLLFVLGSVIFVKESKKAVFMCMTA